MKRAKLFAATGAIFLAGCGLLNVQMDYQSPGFSIGIEGPTASPSVTATLLPPLPGITPSWTPTLTPTLTPTFPPTITPLPATPVSSVPVGAPIVSGHAHSCLLAGGTVWCWGDNTYGQLGDGTTDNRNVPTAVAGLPPNIRAVAAGWGHTCALTAEGGVKCWGYNRNGELGNGSTVDSLLPVDVSGLSSNVMALAAGDDHTCALTGRGGLACWGFNETGQVGDGTIVNSIVPAMVQQLNSPVTAVAAGWGHTCALMDNGGVKCWGDNEFGQLGTGTNHALETSPVSVYGLTSGVRAVSAAGGQTCALLSTTGVECWGNNKYGQLGDGTSEKRSLPIYVHGLYTGASAIAVGWNHSCALSLSGGILCWGWNYYGQLGDGTSTTRTFPVNVSGLDGRTADISLGFDFTCAQNGDHRIHCWGNGEAGQLGSGADNASIHPQIVAQSGYKFSEVPPSPDIPTATATRMPVTPTMIGTGAMSVFANMWNTCALTNAGGVQCWGMGNVGQIGNSAFFDSRVPVQVTGLTSGIRSLTTGEFHSCGITLTYAVKCWGGNNAGQLGNNSTSNSAVPVDATVVTDSVAGLALGADFTCILTTGGGVECFGANDYGQLGNGTNTPSRTPVDVTGLTSGVTAISARYFSICALTSAGAVKCWGDGFYGVLGNGTTDPSNIPVTVTGLASGAAGVSMGGSHACAQMTDGAALCWGWNQAGQLGDGTVNNSLIPVGVSGLSSGVAEVRAGDATTCARTTGGAIKCWGWSGNGLLGGFGGYSSTPVDIAGLSSGVTSLSLGGAHACVITWLGYLQCWGLNGNGQVGNGTTSDQMTPLEIILP